MAKKRKHPFSHTVIEHHKDNSHTIHHIHEKNGFAGPSAKEGDVRGAAGDHDAMVDMLMDNTSDANEGEAAGEAKKPFVAAPGLMTQKS